MKRRCFSVVSDVLPSVVHVRARRLASRDVCSILPQQIGAENVLAALQRLAAGEFPKQSRPKVQPVGWAEAQGVSLGLVSGRGTANCVQLSRGTRLLLDLTRLLCRFMRQHAPRFPFTSIQVNRGFAAREHVDLNNLGPSWIYALGDFEGGELWVHDPRASGADARLPWALPRRARSLAALRLEADALHHAHSVRRALLRRFLFAGPPLARVRCGEGRRAGTGLPAAA